MSIIDKFKNIVGNREISKQEGNFGVLGSAMVIRGLWEKYMSAYYDRGFDIWAMAAKGEHGAVFFCLDEYHYFARRAYSHYADAEANPDRMREYAAFQELQKSVPRFYAAHSPEHLHKLNDENLRQVFEQAIDLVNRVISCTIFSEGLDQEVVASLYREELGTDEGFERFLEVGTKSGFPSFVAKTNALLLEYISGDRSDYDIQWLFANYKDVVSIESTSRKVDEFVAEKGGEKKIADEMAVAYKMANEHKEERTLYKKTLPSRAHPLFDFMELASFVRDERKKIFMMSLVVGYNTARQLLARHRISDENMAFSLPEELLSGDRDFGTYEQVLAERKKGVVVVFNDSVNKVENDPDGVKTQKLYALVGGVTETGGVKEIRGQVASRGVVKGRVAVLLNEDAFDVFQDGDVVVTSMTRPEFVPLLKRCSAIITDEGGITCHAAIVSRELKKPCIIGTKIATQVLKDGDLVEVDADEGVVRIISK